MRGGFWGRKVFLNFGRSPALNWLLLIVVCLLLLIISFASTFLNSPVSITEVSQEEEVFRNYRRLREQAVEDLKDIRSFTSGFVHPFELEFCGRELENHVPCYNVTANQLAGFGNGEEFDRHCDVSGSIPKCLIRPPKDYKVPLRWPLGRDVIWSSNVKITKEQFLSSGSMTKRLMLLEENQIAFQSDDGTTFDGVKDYSHQIAEMIGLGSDSELRQAGVRLVLDIGCGFGSFGAHLFSVKVTTLCVAVYEMYGSQVQLALERGVPAMIGNFLSRQLPYPSLSYDLVHCAECGINWHDKDGVFLIEVDRILKPGGYFVLTSSMSKSHGHAVTAIKQNMLTYTEEFSDKICWSIVAQQDDTIVWQKTGELTCYASRKNADAPPLCKEQVVDSYYSSLMSCLHGAGNQMWVSPPNRTLLPSGSQLTVKEIEDHGIQPDDFLEDTNTWRLTLKNYWSLLTPLIFSDHPKRPGEEDPLPPFNMMRNIMDMNAQYGGLNNALLDEGKSIWVMNVVPVRSPDTLPLILRRGFVGVYHDWCEPFPTYPRTYDMLHAKGLLSQFSSEDCDLLELFLEMDRILRPEGWVILCDTFLLIEKARIIVSQIRWDARMIELQSGSDLWLLVSQKPFLKK